jgi:hypothetical protein
MPYDKYLRLYNNTQENVKPPSTAPDSMEDDYGSINLANNRSRGKRSTPTMDKSSPIYKPVKKPPMPPNIKFKKIGTLDRKADRKKKKSSL